MMKPTGCTTGLPLRSGLTALASIPTPTRPVLAEAVNIADAGATAAATQVANALISPSGQGLDALIVNRSNTDTLKGTYFGAAGTFQCVGDDCQISRDTTGATPYNLSDGQWRFKPDPGAMVMLPDQDWLAFGVLADGA